jgi:DNA-binding NarL/FixJ family response regulator
VSPGRRRGEQPSEPTARELVILRAYLDEGGTRPAAAKLGVAESTVKNTLQNLRSRIGARTTAEAAFRLHEKLVA